MTRFNVFISSVQKEFAEEREALFQHFKTDALLSGFFDPILFERLPAKSQAPNKVYIDEVSQSQIYLGLLGVEYGYEDEHAFLQLSMSITMPRLCNWSDGFFLKVVVL